MEVGVVNALKPGEHGAMGARPTAALPHRKRCGPCP
jgi:hypothetical protein